MVHNFKKKIYKETDYSTQTSRERQAVISHNIFLSMPHISFFVMSHNSKVFPATAFESSGSFYAFK